VGAGALRLVKLGEESIRGGFSISNEFNSRPQFLQFNDLCMPLG
jgi:hypothetical protein